MDKRIIPISLPVTGDEEWHAPKEPLTSGWLTSGPKVRAFEHAFAEHHQVKHAIAVTSATTALHLAMLALDIKQGDEVIVPAFLPGFLPQMLFYIKEQKLFFVILTPILSI